MQYLQAALELKQLIKQVNHLQVQKESSVLTHKNSLFLFGNGKPLAELEMLTFTNEFVQDTLEKYPQTTAFVMTDLASMQVREQKLTYWLYKAYHTGLEKGLVYFQPIDETSLTRIGSLQYSNFEPNIFLKHQAPDAGESSTNAMETEEQEEGSRQIVFLIGNFDEQRLLYDIQRLIFDSLNNVQNHKGLLFRFILNVSKFNGKPSASFLEQLGRIERFTGDQMSRDFPNASFRFDLESE